MDPEARDELLGLGERAVDDGALRAIEANPLAVLAALQSVTGLHDADAVLPCRPKVTATHLAQAEFLHGGQ